jgi:hypothetical protein
VVWPAPRVEAAGGVDRNALRRDRERAARKMVVVTIRRAEAKEDAVEEGAVE